jgi:hypothetical protein
MLFLLTIALIGCGIVVGIVFGVVQKQDEPSTWESPMLSPTMRQIWVKAGEIQVSNGASLSMSPSGNRVAVVDSSIELQDGLVEKELVSVLVYQQETTNVSWSLLGDSIGGTFVSSLSLLGNRLAVASVDPDIGVTVYELQGNATWERVGNEIEVAEADYVLLAQDGNLLAIGARYEVSLHSFTNDTGWYLNQLDTHQNGEKRNGN